MIEHVLRKVDVTLAMVGPRTPLSLKKSSLATILYTMTAKRLARTRQTWEDNGNHYQQNYATILLLITTKQVAMQ